MIDRIDGEIRERLVGQKNIRVECNAALSL